MERKLLQPMELTDAEIDVVSGGHFVGVRQSNDSNTGGKQTINTTSGGAAPAATRSTFNSAFQGNSNTGGVSNTGAISS